MSLTMSYTPTPTMLAFHNSTKPDKAIAGPPGGGKTVGALWECIFRAMRQPPDQNGRRKFRVVIIRATYPNLRLTTFKTIQDWLPPEMGELTMTQPMQGNYSWMQPDGTWVDLELVFLAIADDSEIDKMRSLEMSVIWINEATEVTRAVFEMAQQRVGRYPSPKDNGVRCAEPGVIMDFNLPGTDHWLYDVLVRNVAETMAVFFQPPAVLCTNFEKADAGEEPPQYVMNAQAENLDNLPIGYYEKQLANTTSWNRIKSFLLMKWASFNVGKVVYETFSRSIHVPSVYTEPIPGLPVYVGIDTSGLHPGAVFGQLQMGSLVILAEVYGEDTAFLEFIDKGLKPIIAEKFGGMNLLAICDPANPRDAFTGQTPVQALKRAGINAITAYTNKFQPRREAVVSFLNKRAGLAIDVRCVTLIQALEEKYVYRKLKIQSTSGAQYASEPEKNEWSHVVDALQYLCLYVLMPNGPVESAGTHISLKGRVRPRRLL